MCGTILVLQRCRGFSQWSTRCFPHALLEARECLGGQGRALADDEVIRVCGFGRSLKGLDECSAWLEVSIASFVAYMCKGRDGTQMGTVGSLGHGSGGPSTHISACWNWIQEQDPAKGITILDLLTFYLRARRTQHGPVHSRFIILNIEAFLSRWSSRCLWMADSST